MTKTVAITGAGSGIGKTIAKTLSEQSYSLLLLGRDRSRLEETRESLSNPEDHKSFACDIRQPEEIRKALAESGAESLYGVIANAGVGGENHYGKDDRWQ